ncbi:MAG: zinc ABC transporter substrate-binding protein [bacterium]
MLIINSNAYSQEKGAVVVTTSMLEVIVRNIVKDNIDVVSLCPGSLCPGHSDISAERMVRLHKANLVIKHGWEKYLDNVLDKLEDAPIEVRSVDFLENGMIPDAHVKLVNKVFSILSKQWPYYEKTFYTNKEKYIAEIRKKADLLRPDIEKLKGLKVVCSEKLVSLLKNLGMDIVDHYGRPESFTVRKIRDLMLKIRKEDVVLIVNNMQSGSDAGELFERENPKIKQINITNFPIKNTSDAYLSAFEDNIRLLNEALE